MISKNKNDDFVQEIFKLIPEDLRRHRDDVRKNIQAALNARLSRMDLVTREEFDIQSELLSRTRAMLDELEKRIEELEEKRNSTQA